MQARPFLILGDRARAHLVRWAQQCADEWALRWLAKGARAPAVSWIAPPAADRWLVADGGDRQVVAVGYPEELLAHAGVLLAGEEVSRPAASELVREMFETALRELAVCLSGSGEIELRREVPSVEDSGVPFVTLSCRFGDDLPVVTLLCWPERAARLLADLRSTAAVRLHPLASVLQDQRVSIRAQLGTAELTLSEVATLARGDVVVLQQRLDEPLTLTTDEGREIAVGQLCATRGRRAVRTAQPVPA